MCPLSNQKIKKHFRFHKIYLFQPDYGLRILKFNPNAHTDKINSIMKGAV